MLYLLLGTGIEITTLAVIGMDYIGGSSWPWSYGSWIYNYLCNQCLSPLKLWDRIPLL